MNKKNEKNDHLLWFRPNLAAVPTNEAMIRQTDDVGLLRVLRRGGTEAEHHQRCEAVLHHQKLNKEIVFQVKKCFR